MNNTVSISVLRVSLSFSKKRLASLGQVREVLIESKAEYKTDIDQLKMSKDESVKDRVELQASIKALAASREQLEVIDREMAKLRKDISSFKEQIFSMRQKTS